MNKRTYKVNSTNEDDEDFVMTRGKAPLGFTVRSKQVNSFSIHINEDIKSPDYYSKIFDLLLDAGEEDMITFFICSPGGRLDGLNILLEGIRLTDAHTVAVLLGEAHSAASILALNCNEVVVTDSTEALIHSCRFGAAGKAADIAAQTEHMLKITEKLSRKTYEGFLSESELQMMLDGKEWYFDADQIRERLEKRNKYFEEKYAKENTAPAFEGEVKGISSNLDQHISKSSKSKTKD